MADVFVSYSRRDSDFVGRLTRAIEECGKQVWLDTEGIADADVFPQAIRTAIEGSDAFLFVITPASVASRYCESEVDYARQLGKRIVPILREAVDDDGLPAAIRDRSWIPFADEATFRGSLERLLRAVDTDLEFAREHTRWLVKAIEWDSERRDRSFLLRGSELRVAEGWLALASGDSEPAPTTLQRHYLLTSRAAAARRQRTLVGASLAVAAVAITLLVFALIARGQAISEKLTATSQALAAESENQVAVDPEASVRLAISAVKTAATKQAVFALRAALDASPLRLAVRNASVSQREVTCGNESGPAATFSPNGSRIAEGGCSGQVTILDAVTGRALQRVTVARYAPAVAYSPSGSLLAVGTGSGVVLLDARTLARRATLPGYGMTDDVAFSPNGAWIAAASDGGLVEWSVRTHAQRWVASGNTGFRTVTFTANGRYVLAGSQSTSGIPVYDARNGRLVRTLEASGQASAGDVVAGDSGGEEVAVGALSADGVGRVSIWSTTRWKELFTLASVPGDQITALAFSPDGDRLAIGAADGTAGIWSVPAREKILALVGDTAEINQVVFNVAGSRALTASDDGTTRVWGAQESERVGIDSPFGSAGTIQDLRLLGSRIVAVGILGARDVAFTWRLPTGKLISTASLGPASSAFSDTPTLSPDGRYALVINNAGVATARSVSTGKVAANLAAVSVNAVAENEDDERFAVVVPLDGSNYEYEIVNGDGKRMRGLAPAGLLTASCPADLLAFSPNDKLVAAASFCGQVTVWNARTGRLLSTFDQHGQISSIAFSPAAPRLAVGSWDATTTVWDVNSGRAVHDLNGDARGVDGVAYSPDGARILTTSIDDTARLWNAASGVPLRVLAIPQRAGDPQFSPDGQSIADEDSNGVIRVWDTCPACGDARALLSQARHAQTGIHVLTRLEANAVGSGGTG
ncbi:MAG TPA: TIR domain-containing protein [Solirubrobacteraceae bacterium]|nr:TIR domain-containing protein [Solirubrobacteraceae bacterium]